MSNNVYKQCPAKMEDGRFITRYESSNDITNTIQSLNHIHSSNQFRLFLQQNTDKIIDSERKYNDQHYTCAPPFACSEGYVHTSNLKQIDNKKTNHVYNNSINESKKKNNNNIFAVIENMIFG
jgi:hypothetical protein